MSAPILRVGILGAAKIAPRGMIAPAHSRPDVEVTCIAARDPARARAFAAEHGIPNIAQDYAALLQRDDVDLVYVALPAGLHAEWSIKALEAGKAVLCEKPFSLDLSQARAMVEASVRYGRPLFEALHYRHHPVMMHAVEIVRGGSLGRLLDAEAVFETSITYREDELRWRRELGGGALMDLGVYCLHALRSVAGGEPRVLNATSVMARGVDASTLAELAFEGGLVARISCSMTPPRLLGRLTVRGEAGVLDITNFMAPQLGCSFTLTRGDDVQVFPVDPITSFAAQLGHLVAVMNGEAEPLVGGEDALANMALVDAVYRLSRPG